MAKQLRSIQRYVNQVHEKARTDGTILGKLMKFYEDQHQNQKFTWAADVGDLPRIAGCIKNKDEDKT